MKTLKLIQSDSYLRPYASAIEGRYNYAVYQEKKLAGGQKLSEWANGHLYFGLHKVNQQWIFREWAPNATAIYIIGDFNGWQRMKHTAFSQLAMAYGRLRCLPML